MQRNRNMNHNMDASTSDSDETKDDIDLIDDVSDDQYYVSEEELEDKWWKDAIKPYKEANEEEHAADKDLAEAWRMESTNIHIFHEQISYEIMTHEEFFDDNDDDEDDPDYEYEQELKANGDHGFERDDEVENVSQHTLYLTYEDEKSAKIQPQRTYVNFTFKCRYNIRFETINTEEDIRNTLENCDLVDEFAIDCKTNSAWLKQQSNVRHPTKESRIYGGIYKNYKTYIHILSIIAGFAVIPDKHYRDCVSCYFNICDSGLHLFRLMAKDMA